MEPDHFLPIIRFFPMACLQGLKLAWTSLASHERVGGGVVFTVASRLRSSQYCRTSVSVILELKGKKKEQLRLVADLSLKGNQIPKRIAWRVFSGLRQTGWEGPCLLKFHPDGAWEREDT